VAGIIDVNTMFGVLPEAGLGVSADVLCAMARRAGIRRILTMSATGLMWDHRVGNEETLKAASVHEEILPVATVDPRRYFGGELVSLADKGCVAARLFPDTQGYSLDEAPCLAALKEGADRLPFIVEVRRRGTASALGRAARESGGRFIIAGLTEDLLGEAAAVLTAAESAQIYVECSALVGMGAIELLVERAGADRVLFGSGIPVVPPECAVENVEGAALDETQREAILSGNAAKLFREAVA
jgi:predicted TIM-barrel fold metal-dependent hydrolase